MHTYFVSYSSQAPGGPVLLWETVVPLRKPVSEKADLQAIKAYLVRELAEKGVTVVESNIHLSSVQHLHSRPSGAPAP